MQTNLAVFLGQNIWQQKETQLELQINTILSSLINFPKIKAKVKIKGHFL